MGPVRTVIATAEPRGAYHLSALAGAFAAPGHIAHLVPYPEPVQGRCVLPVTHDLDILSAARRLVVTGGGWSSWTAATAWRAHQLGVELRFVSLADVTCHPPNDTPRPDLFAARSPRDARTVAALHGVAATQVTVTGTPELDNLRPWHPDGSVLLVSTSDLVRRDPQKQLLTAAQQLADNGTRVRVRLHPREDLALWSNLELRSNIELIGADEPPTTSAARASAVLSYPGSLLPTLAAAGPPVVCHTPSTELAALLDDTWRSATSTVTTTLDDALTAVTTAAPVAPALLDDLVGPRGGARHRLAAFIHPTSSNAAAQPPNPSAA